jgi:hypothetical protein
VGVVTQVMRAGTKVRPDFELVTQVAQLRSICLAQTGFPLGEFVVIVNHQLGFLGMKQSEENAFKETLVNRWSCFRIPVLSN